MKKITLSILLLSIFAICFHVYAENKKELNKKLVEAVLIGDSDNVKKLLDQGANPNIKDDQNCPLIVRAVSKEFRLTTKYLLDAGADIHSKDAELEATPLAFAALNGDYKLAKRLIKAGAKVNLRIKNKSRSSILIIAVSSKKSNNKLIELLLKSGAKASSKDTGGFDVETYALLNKRISFYMVQQIKKYAKKEQKASK